MLQLGRTQASTIFKARTRMLQVKNNYKNAHKNLTCRACQKENETQEHVLTACPVIHNNPNNKIEKYELFSENPEDLKLTYHKLTTIMRKLELCSSWNKSVEQPGTSGYTHAVAVADSWGIKRFQTRRSLVWNRFIPHSSQVSIYHIKV